jgi:hypothetical protein
LKVEHPINLRHGQTGYFSASDRQLVCGPLVGFQQHDCQLPISLQQRGSHKVSENAKFEQTVALGYADAVNVLALTGNRRYTTMRFLFAFFRANKRYGDLDEAAPAASSKSSIALFDPSLAAFTVEACGGASSSPRRTELRLQVW